ncbi:hypothetical protein FSP39_021083 [Pinctada imbricata]|uniref:DNA topoisomerase n=1 Tax=Pinctada imbricata TaxID=66713 RepID=A0AA89C274_PINIB|nr:hypothetical protein FSP39_021083 [Pinctada imbricata]
MVRILNVAEKNDAAKSIAEVMSRGSARKREGFSKFNKIYEFDYNIMNQPSTMTMTSVSGHLLGLDFVGSYKKWYSCSPVALFDIDVEKHCPKDFQDIKRTLEREVRGCQSLIIWTDCDREGENIGFEVIQVCKAVKPNIPVYRARFSEITPQAIQRACRNLLPPDKNTSDAVDVRSELDLRIGAAFTRFQTLRLQKIFPEVLGDQLISYGSCQFPTLGFVVERYKQVQAFVPEPFWKIKVAHTYNDTSCEFSWKRYRLFDHFACLAIYEQCVENPTARVVDVRCKPKSKWRPQPLDTVELEKLASRKLRINAKETMKIAESLYTKGFISYPRTETNIFPKDLDLRGLVEQQTRDQNWGEFASRVLEQGPNPRNGKKTDQAHPPIHPTKYTDSLQGNDGRIYEFIVRHFLACCSQDAQGQETVIEIDVAEERFTAQGLMITARNYLEVYPYETWNAKTIPVYENGDVFTPNAIEMAAGETQPPPLLSEADLIALMEKHGIGTDATHAEHIETIKNRMYVGVRPDGRFVPGQLGMGLVEGYDAMGYEMSKPHLRAELEADLKRYLSHIYTLRWKLTLKVVLQEQIRKYKEVFIEACRQAIKIDQALSQYLGEAKNLTTEEILDQMAALPVKKCPNCGQDMLLKTKKDGKGYYIGCMGYPDCRNAIWMPDFVLEAEVTDQHCRECQAKKIKFKFKRGSVPPMMSTEYVGCIGGCDRMLTEVLGISNRNGVVSSQRPKPTNTQSSANDSGYSSSGFVPSGNSRSYHTSPPQSYPTSSQTSYPNPSQRPGYMGTNSSARGAQSGNRNNSFSGATSRAPLVPVQPFNVNPRGGAGAGSGGDKTVVCNCGSDAIMLTVRKEGPNTGRQFYKCGNSQCNFFLWADEADGGGGGRGGGQNENRNYGNYNRGNSGSGYSSGNQYDRSNGGSESGSVPSCGCGNTAKSLTVQKEGPNKGRPFYACNKPRGEGCNFFQWADEEGSASSFNSGGRFGGGGGGGGGGTTRKKRSADSDGGGPSTKRAARKCGLCGEEGMRGVS